MEINKTYLVLVVDNCRRTSYVMDIDKVDEDELIERVDNAMKDVENSDYAFYYSTITLQTCKWRNERKLAERLNLLQIVLHKDNTSDIEGKLFLFDEIKNYNLRRLCFNLKLDDRLHLEENIELI